MHFAILEETLTQFKLNLDARNQLLKLILYPNLNAKLNVKNYHQIHKLFLIIEF
jgi:hypothetical protein